MGKGIPCCMEVKLFQRSIPRHQFLGYVLTPCLFTVVLSNRRIRLQGFETCTPTEEKTSCMHACATEKERERERERAD